MDLPDSVMRLCCDFYESLPKTGKPKENEWTMMSAVVGIFENEPKILSLGTGSKCIGSNALSSNGDVLHDSHSEVIARRAFLKYLLLEIMRFNKTNLSDLFNREDESSLQVSVKKDVRFCFVTSFTPCGDASIIPKEIWDTDFNCEMYCELLKPTKNKAKRTGNVKKRTESDPKGPDKKRLKTDSSDSQYDGISLTDSSRSEVEDVHRTGAKCLPSSSVQDLHLPGMLYHEIGVVRTKPGRGNPTSSVSCSDKIARWNAVGIQGALLSLLISTPIYLDFIVIGGGCPFSKSCFDRAVNARIGKKEFTPVYQSSLAFPDAKSINRTQPFPTSLIWCRSDQPIEVSVNGRKQGVTKKNLNKKSSRTSICKKEMFSLFQNVLNSFKRKENLVKTFFEDIKETKLQDLTYKQVKLSAKGYQRDWESVRSNYFKIWTEKPDGLLNFTVGES